MWNGNNENRNGATGFFRLSQSYTTLARHYRTINELCYRHPGYSYSDIEMLYPYERGIAVDMLNQFIEEKIKAEQQQKQKAKRG